jgi:hypothetical protein
MSRATGLRSQLPPPGLARWATIGALLVGALVAAGLTALIAIFAVTWLSS